MLMIVLYTMVPLAKLNYRSQQLFIGSLANELACVCACVCACVRKCHVDL